MYTTDLVRDYVSTPATREMTVEQLLTEKKLWLSVLHHAAECDDLDLCKKVAAEHRSELDAVQPEQWHLGFCDLWRMESLKPETGEWWMNQFHLEFDDPHKLCLVSLLMADWRPALARLLKTKLGVTRATFDADPGGVSAFYNRALWPAFFDKNFLDWFVDVAAITKADLIEPPKYGLSDEAEAWLAERGWGVRGDE